MKKEIVLTTVTVVGIIILVPIVIKSTNIASLATAAVVSSLMDKAKFHKQMHRLMKEGKIVKIGGEYYNVVDVTEEE